MSLMNSNNASTQTTQLRTLAMRMGEPYRSLPPQSFVAALARHGGMYSLLDSDMMTSRIGALAAGTGAVAPPSMASRLQALAESFFYKLDTREGYLVHSELMAYISEPGQGNGVAYDEGVQPSDRIPAVFTFVGQFIDHDLTFNGMNLTEDERGQIVLDKASPVIDLDSVYGPRDQGPQITQIFDAKGRFKLRPVPDSHGFDVPRSNDQSSPMYGAAFILDPRNDENQLILQIHILLQRLHNKLIDSGALANQLAVLEDPHDRVQIVECVRKVVVAIWQSFVLNEYLPAIIRQEVLTEVLQQIHVEATDPEHPEAQYGALKHKPYKDLVTGKNVVRMPHEFAIGFRFGHSQLRPFYVLNQHTVALLFKDARASYQVTIQGYPKKVSGKDDLRGGRHLHADHVLDWSVFYPEAENGDTMSLLIDHKVTARVFNLPESAIPDDIKYIGNLAHRNLLRGSQIGVVSGEELADFYGVEPLTPAQVLIDPQLGASEALFKLDVRAGEPAKFKTPLWYYIIREAEVHSQGGQLGRLGSRLVAEVLVGALYYGNEFAYDDNWTPPAGFASNKVKLRDILAYVGV